MARVSPISWPLLVRTLKDYQGILLLGLGLSVGWHWLYVSLIPKYKLRYRLHIIDNLPQFFKAMIGDDILQITTTTGLGSFAYLHPISLALLLALAVWIASGAIAGQIDRGTVDLVLATPLSRRRFMITTILAGAISGAVMTAGMLLGTWMGLRQVTLEQPYMFDRIVLVAANLYAVYLVAFSYAVFFSALSTLRSTAVGWAFGLSLALYLLHFLSEWWDVVHRISFMGPLYYFRPIKIAAGNYDPTNDIALMCGIAVVLFAIATVCFSRRNINVL
ncbi:MAG: ABC transporter permease subunit [Phycisphaerae bacterium]|nr:ABC transporter permease subunit [Phycisphaerae bacterium]